MTGQIVTDKGNLIQIHRTFIASPTISAPTLFKIGTGTTNPTALDTDLETGVNINGGSTKGFVTGYPVIDETSLQATVRTLLDTTEGNGNSLTEFGLFNTDGSPLMFSHSVFTPITKNNKVLISFVEKDKL